MVLTAMADCNHVLWIAAAEAKARGPWAGTSIGFGIDIGFNNIKVE